MKCVRDQKTGAVVRVTEAAARELVEAGADYTTKTAWRRQVAKELSE